MASRQMKIQWFIEEIGKRLNIAQQPICRVKLIADFCICFGSTRETGKDIIQILEEAGRINKNIWKS